MALAVNNDVVLENNFTINRISCSVCLRQTCLEWFETEGEYYESGGHYFLNQLQSVYYNFYFFVA